MVIFHNSLTDGQADTGAFINGLAVEPLKHAEYFFTVNRLKSDSIILVVDTGVFDGIIQSNSFHLFGCRVLLLNEDMGNG